MKLLIDINVVLDVVLARMPWAEKAANLLSAIEAGTADGYVVGHTVTTLHYIVAKQRDRRAATAAVSDLLGIVAVVPLEHADFQRALLLALRDFEDAVQAAAALRIGADYLVTRNTSDFRRLRSRHPHRRRGAGAAVGAPKLILGRLLTAVCPLKRKAAAETRQQSAPPFGWRGRRKLTDAATLGSV